MNTIPNDKQKELKIEALTKSNKKYEIKVIQRENDIFFISENKEGIINKKYKMEITFENFQKLKLFLMCQSLNDVFMTIQDYLQINSTQSINNIIIEKANSIILIIPLQLRLIKELNFELKEEKQNIEEVMISLIKELDESKKKIDKLEQALNNQEKIINIKDKEINELKNKLIEQNNMIKENESKVENKLKNMENNILIFTINMLNQTQNKFVFIDQILNDSYNKASIRSLLVTRNSELISGLDDSNINIYILNKNNNRFEYINKLIGHKGAVHCLCEPKKENYILSGSADKTIKLWDILKYECLKSFIGHTDIVMKIIFSNEERIISCSLDKTIKIWDIEGNTISTLIGHNDGVYVIEQIKDGRLISFSGNNDRSVRFWDLKTNKCQPEHSLSQWTGFGFYDEIENKFYNPPHSLIYETNLDNYTVKTYSNGIEGKSNHEIIKLNNNWFIVRFDYKKDGQFMLFDKDLKNERLINYPFIKANATKLILWRSCNKFITGDSSGNIIIWNY